MNLAVEVRSPDDLNILCNQLGVLDYFDGDSNLHRLNKHVVAFSLPFGPDDTDRLNELLDTMEPTLVRKAVLTHQSDDGRSVTLITLHNNLTIDETYEFDDVDDPQKAVRRQLSELDINLPVRIDR